MAPGLVKMRPDRVEDAKQPKGDQPEAKNADAEILRLGGGEKPEQGEQAIKGQEEHARAGHGVGSFLF